MEVSPQDTQNTGENPQESRGLEAMVERSATVEMRDGRVYLGTQQLGIGRRVTRRQHITAELIGRLRAASELLEKAQQEAASGAFHRFPRPTVSREHDA